MRLPTQQLRSIVRSEILLEYMKKLNEDRPSPDADGGQARNLDISVWLTDRDAGNKFRQWVIDRRGGIASNPLDKRDPKPEDALDPDGEHDNNYIKAAWKKVGKAYVDDVFAGAASPNPEDVTAAREARAARKAARDEAEQWNWASATNQLRGYYKKVIDGSLEIAA